MAAVSALTCHPTPAMQERTRPKEVTMKRDFPYSSTETDQIAVAENAPKDTLLQVDFLNPALAKLFNLSCDPAMLVDNTTSGNADLCGPLLMSITSPKRLRAKGITYSAPRMSRTKRMIADPL